MLKRKSSSYIDTLSPAKESQTVKEYDPSITEGQIGKEHEEEVAKSNNWGDDKRDSVEKAARKKRLATKLRRIARELEAIDMNEEYEEKIEDAVDQAEDEVDQVEDEVTSEELQFEEMKKSKATRDEFIIMEAATEGHPKQDIQSDPSSSMSAQTGDDEWIDIGPATFLDARDAVGKASY